MSLKQTKKELRFAGKGHNETLEYTNVLEDATAATETSDGHVPEDGGTWFSFWTCHCAFAVQTVLHALE
jgi:hypothetical protein